MAAVRTQPVYGDEAVYDNKAGGAKVGGPASGTFTHGHSTVVCEYPRAPVVPLVSLRFTPDHGAWVCVNQAVQSVRPRCTERRRTITVVYVLGVSLLVCVCVYVCALSPSSSLLHPSPSIDRRPSHTSRLPARPQARQTVMKMSSRPPFLLAFPCLQNKTVAIPLEEETVSKK